MFETPPEVDPQGFDRRSKVNLGVVDKTTPSSIIYSDRIAIEGEIVNKIYAAADAGIDAAIFNPAAFGSGYPALIAAISQVKFPTIEVHITNIHAREPFRHQSYVSMAAKALVCGFGIAGYALAIDGLAALVKAGRS